jgi:hypothetical protein
MVETTSIIVKNIKRMIRAPLRDERRWRMSLSSPDLSYLIILQGEVCMRCFQLHQLRELSTVALSALANHNGSLFPLRYFYFGNFRRCGNDRSVLRLSGSSPNLVREPHRGSGYWCFSTGSDVGCFSRAAVGLAINDDSPLGRTLV